VFLYTPNDPIIESSKNLKFAPYNVGYPLLDQHVAQVNFDVTANKWDLIFDFTKDDAKLNYAFLDPSEFYTVTKEIPDLEGSPVPVAPFALPERYGGTLANDINEHARQHDDNMMAFSITTSA